MMIIYFFYGLCFSGLGLASYLQLRRGGDFPLRKLLPWLAAFGFSAGASGWVEMFLVNEANPETIQVLQYLQLLLQPVSGLLLLIFGWGIFAKLQPLPPWAIFIPGVLIVPVAYVITYALSTFITSSPIQIPIDIWSRYLLYLPGSVLAGVGFLRQWSVQRKLGVQDVASLMLGAGLAFLVEAFVVGLVVPAAPYGPTSYYNYDRVAYNAFSGESSGVSGPYGLTAWLDYQRVLDVTGLPIQFWRMLSAFAVTGFVVRGLDVFETVQRRMVQGLQAERDRAQQAAIQAQTAARQAAESWSDALVRISNRIAELEDADSTLVYIVENALVLLQADFIGLALVSGSPPALALRYCAYPGSAKIVKEHIPVDHALILRTLESGVNGAACIADRNQIPPSAAHFSQLESATLAAVPLPLDNRKVGVLWAARDEPRAFTEADLIWLECLGDHVVIAVKHGLMTSQLQSLSVIEERGRIAREMHDGLAQVLGYLNLQVQTLEACLQQGKLEKLQVKLDEMHTAVQSAHADVRENILSLRTTLANEKGFVQAIQEYLEEFGIQTGIKTQFSNQAGDELDLASISEVQLVCILQEALTNVRKHARARQVSVEISKDESAQGKYILLRVRDDGVGFTPGRQKRSFGLQTMTERAESVGGSLVVWSQPGQGARVDCFIPSLPREQLQPAEAAPEFRSLPGNRRL